MGRVDGRDRERDHEHDHDDGHGDGHGQRFAEHGSRNTDHGHGHGQRSTEHGSRNTDHEHDHDFDLDHDHDNDPDHEPGPGARFAQATGRLAFAAGAAIGRAAANAYRSVDPDVFRHLAQLPLMSYSLLVPRKGGVEPGTPDGHPPLVFVHGLAGARGNFLLMTGYLWARGRRRSYHVHLEGGRSIGEMADDLVAFVREVVEATGEPQVEIVAHSLGGVVSRLAIQDRGLDDAVRTLVTLGSPHRGTYSARFANTQLTRELRPDSALIRGLAAGRWPGQVRLVALWSHNDLLVVPGEHAAVDDGESIEMTPFTHYSYLVEPAGWAEVARVLAAAAGDDDTP